MFTDMMVLRKEVEVRMGKNEGISSLFTEREGTKKRGELRSLRA
jgi:hypothetical protein